MQKNRITIRVITTGGTFDKHYDEIAGALCFGAGHLTEIITRARITLPVVLEQLPFLDSLDMQDADRQGILSACANATESAIVVIHGTDTMRETAEMLGRAQSDKTIVLTGAIIPYEIVNSDATFNFGFAVGVAQTLAPGVYIAMNGRIFSWDEVEKNRTVGIFQPA